MTKLRYEILFNIIKYQEKLCIIHRLIQYDSFKFILVFWDISKIASKLINSYNYQYFKIK